MLTPFEIATARSRIICHRQPSCFSLFPARAATPEATAAARGMWVPFLSQEQPAESKYESFCQLGWCICCAGTDASAASQKDLPQDAPSGPLPQPGKQQRWCFTLTLYAGGSVENRREVRLSAAVASLHWKCWCSPPSSKLGCKSSVQPSCSNLE